MSWTNVRQKQSVSVTTTIATTAVEGQWTRVRGFTILTKGTAGGNVVYKELNGTARITEAVPTVANLWLYIKPADAGVRFENGLLVSVPASVVVGTYYD